MKKVLSKLKHNTLFGFIIGIILCSGIVYGSNVYQSSAIEYSPTDSSWNVSNVSDAINSLHSMVKELENIKSIGDATAAQILSGKKAVVKGSTITGAMTNRGAWTNTPTSSGKVTIPAGYHNGSGYVDTTNLYNIGVDEGAKYTSGTLVLTYRTQVYIHDWNYQEIGNYDDTITIVLEEGNIVSSTKSLPEQTGTFKSSAHSGTNNYFVKTYLVSAKFTPNN